MRDYNERLELELESGGVIEVVGGGGVRCMTKREGPGGPGVGEQRRWVVEGGRQPSLYSRGARTDGMSDRVGRRKGGGEGDERGCRPCQGQGNNNTTRHTVGMREERRMTRAGEKAEGGGGGRTKTTRQHQLHVVVSPSQQRRYVIKIRGRGGSSRSSSSTGGGSCSGAGGGGCIVLVRNSDKSTKRRTRRISACSSVKRNFNRPRGHHIHYANSFGQQDSSRCPCECLNSDRTCSRDVSSSDAIVDRFDGSKDDSRRRQHHWLFTSCNVTKKSSIPIINRRKSLNLGVIFKYRILLHVILFFYHLSHFSTLANPAHHHHSSSSSSSSSLSSNPAPYNLLSPVNPSNIQVHFSPPSITQLQINKPQTIFFNFTVYHRPWNPRPLGSNHNNNNNSYSNSNAAGKADTNNNTDQNRSNNKNTRTKSNNVFNNIINKLKGVEVAFSDSAASPTAATPTFQTTNTFLSNNSSGSRQQQQLDSSFTATTTTTAFSFLSPNSQPVTTPGQRNHSNFTPSSTLVTDATPGTFHQHTTQEDQPRHRYWVMIYSNDNDIAHPKLSKPPGVRGGGGGGGLSSHPDKKDSKKEPEATGYMLMTVTPGRQYNFSVEAKHIGRTTMSLAVVDAGGVVVPLPKPILQFDVASVRGERTADIVFNSAAAAIAILISFGMGASTEMESIKRQLKYPVSLIVGFCCQFIIMPVLAFGVAMALPLDKEDKDIRFGLLCTACVPGGGLGHIAVVIADGDTGLSATINLISVVAMLGIAPLWIFVLGQYFQTESDAALSPRMMPIFNFEIWLVASFLAYMAGLIVKRFRSPVADAILMWLIKPFLLLASILYITIGVYINMYVFKRKEKFALLGAVLLPFCGCVLGGGLAALCRQGNTFVKTIALETTSLNCVLVLVALRFSLRQPDADLASMIPIWVMFTTPGFFVFLNIVKRIKSAVVHYWRNRSSSKKDAELLGSMKAYSVSSSAVSPPGTTTLSAPLVVADGMDDDLTISTTSNQKVTVL